MVKDDDRIAEIDSCGTGAYHELDPPDYRTMATLKKHGIQDYEHAARQVTSSDFSDFDYVFAMDSSNLRDLQRLQKRADSKGGKSKAKVMLFGEFSGQSRAEEIGDPYYGANNGFETAYEQVKRFSTNFLKSLDEEGGRS